MKFQIRGNYFDSKFVLPPLSGPNSVDQSIIRECPADISLKLWECPIDYRHVDKVLDSAIEGFRFWRKLSQADRVGYLKRYQESVLKRVDEIALAIAYETGKPLWEAKGEAQSVAAKVSVTIEESLPRVSTQTIDNILPATQGHIYYKPLGPCLVIGPFNFPCHLANGQILSALVAGNSVIFKPSEKTCYSAQLLVECFHDAGFPKGVINLIHGDGEVVRRILKAKEIKGIYFTGSKEVGLKILRSTYEDLSKLVALELGGKNTTILAHDTNIDLALQETLRASFLTTGQRCTSTAIVAIHESIQDEFIEKFHALSKRIIVDHPIDYEVEPFMGPLVDQKAMDTYLLFMGMAKREGIQEVMRGKHLERKTQGYYVSPSIHFSKTFDPNSHFLTSEIFGPNCTFIPFKEIEEAIDIANSTEYGLAASIFTKDENIYKQCVLDIDAGILNLNRSTVGASAKLPFGGVKNSGNYRPAALTTIDSCVYQMASLEVQADESSDLSSIKGLKA